jgi:hypothetical protein
VACGLGFERNNGQLLPHDGIDECALACNMKQQGVQYEGSEG